MAASLSCVSGVWPAPCTPDLANIGCVLAVATPWKAHAVACPVAGLSFVYARRFVNEEGDIGNDQQQPVESAVERDHS